MEVRSNKYTSTELVTQTRPAIFSARKTQLYTSSMFLFRTVVSTALRGIQLFLTVPLVFCAGIFFKELTSEMTPCALDSFCRQSQGHAKQIEDYFEVLILCAVVALVVIGIMVAIAFLLKYLNKPKGFPDGWGNVLTLPQETTAQRIASWGVALAVVVGIYWYLTGS